MAGEQELRITPRFLAQTVRCIWWCHCRGAAKLGENEFNLNKLQEVVKIWKAAGLLSLGLPIPGVTYCTLTLLNSVLHGPLGVSYLPPGLPRCPRLLSCTPQTQLPQSLKMCSGSIVAVKSDLPGRAQDLYPGGQALSHSWVGSQGKSSWSGAGHVQLSTRTGSQGRARNLGWWEGR